MNTLLTAILLSTLALACSGDELKAAGSQCFGSAECADGLTCDFGQSPSVCAPGQTDMPVDAANIVDSDATQAETDARVTPAPDARVAPVPDAMQIVPDATLLDAGLPDATLLDAAPDAAA